MPPLGPRPLLISTALLVVAVSAGSAESRRAAFSERRLDSPEVRAAVSEAGGGTGWNLKALTAAALYFHSDLELARAQWATAEAGLITAGARPNPSLALVPQFTTPLRTYENGTYSANLDVPIETAGKRARRLDQAGHTAEASRYTLEATAWMVRGRLRQNLVTLYGAQKRFEILKTSVKHQMATTEMLQRRVTAGESSRPELFQTRLLYNQTELALADAQKQMAEARAGVAGAIGVPLAAMRATELELGGFAHLPGVGEVAAWTRDGLSRRSDVFAARAEKEAAVAAVRTELAKRFPDLHVLPGYSYDSMQNKVELGFSFDLPILNQNRGPIAEAKAKIAEAEARLRGAEAKASAEIEFAELSYRGSLAKLQKADTLLADQQKAQQAAQRLFDAGETDRLSLMTAEVERDTMAALRLDAFLEAQKALGALEQAVQKTADGWQPRLSTPVRRKP
jgi:cobalt-zinc-cadmium efflux system outer membrane protein